MKRKFIFLFGWILSMVFTISLSAQVTCAGTFGDNIFYEGDFGSGARNIISGPAGLAPGYSYTDQMPPSDGYYTITNDMSKWSDKYSSWIDVGDHSSDPLGYMMVVNASYSPGKFYEQTIDSLCSNTVYEFSADILNVVRTETTGHSRPDLDFLIDDSVRYSTGEIPQDEKWYKHGFTFSLKPGQTSIKLTLVNKAPGGTGNDLALDNITFRPCGPDPDLDLATNLSFCQDHEQPAFISTNIDTSRFYIQWQTTRTPGLDWKDSGERNALAFMQELDEPGTYYYRYKISTSSQNLNNSYCLSHSETVTAEVLPIHFEIWDTICAGLHREFNGRMLTETGDYTATLVSTQGCDSIVALHLEVVEEKGLDFDLLAGHPQCHDSQDGFVKVTNTIGGYPPYNYYLDTDTNRNGIFPGLVAGMKGIEIRDQYGCHIMKEVELINPPLFDLYSLPDTQMVLGQPLTIQIAANQPILSVSATPDILHDCDDCREVTFVPVISSDIFIEATNVNGCISTESFFIEVDDENIPIAFPNAFTPNGDGTNDVFSLISPSQLIRKIISVRILDRWGNVIHSSPKTIIGSSTLLWKGENGEDAAEPGVYAYVCEAELINGEVKLFSGEVTVMR